MQKAHEPAKQFIPAVKPSVVCAYFHANSNTVFHLHRRRCDLLCYDVIAAEMPLDYKHYTIHRRPFADQNSITRRVTIKWKETLRPTKATVQVKMTARWGSVYEVFSILPPPLPSCQISRVTFTSGVHSVDIVQTSHGKWMLSCHFQRSQTPNNLTGREKQQQQKESARFPQTRSLRACRSGVKSLPEIFISIRERWIKSVGQLLLTGSQHSLGV